MGTILIIYMAAIPVLLILVKVNSETYKFFHEDCYDTIVVYHYMLALIWPLAIVLYVSYLIFRIVTRFIINKIDNWRFKWPY